MSKRIPTKKNNQRGTSLVELMVSMIIMGISSAAIFGMLFLNYDMGKKSTNKIDAVNAVRTALDRICRDVRMARSIGDVFGDSVADTQNPYTVYDDDGNPAGTAYPQMVEGSSSFPSTQNPIYGAGQAPPKGWPWSGPPYALSGTTLVVQVPIFDTSGFPTAIESGYGSPAAPCPQANVETHIYRVVADPDQTNYPGEYILQFAKIPGKQINDSGGNAIYNPTSAQFGPQTLVRGIVGPTEVSTGNLRIFQFLDKTSTDGQPENTVTGALLANYTGVIANLVIRKHDASTKLPTTLAFKTEVFMRNNALATTVGMPSSAE